MTILMATQYARIPPPVKWISRIARASAAARFHRVGTGVEIRPLGGGGVAPP